MKRKLIKYKLIQCPYCPCKFVSARDYAFHQQAHIMYPERFVRMNRARQPDTKYQIQNMIRGALGIFFDDEEKVEKEEEEEEEWE